jgi:nucleotide-binding universal stress UspA family protein
MPASFKQILVHLDPTAAMPDRLAGACTVAARQGAALSALYAVTPAFIELPFAPEIGPTLAADLVALDDERRDTALKAFDRVVSRAGTTADWSQTDEVPTTGAFVQQAYFADLLVLGQYNPADPDSRCLPVDFVQSVVLDGGRPALVVPHVGWKGNIGSTVAIAWKETPEAARAVTAALPFLQQARQVHILAWGEPEVPRIGGKTLDLDGYLKLHGVSATWHREGPEPSGIGELLLSRIFDLGADLLVMGCYGHSRAREWILGGASRAILRSMTLPVLMAH